MKILFPRFRQEMFYTLSDLSNIEFLKKEWISKDRDDSPYAVQNIDYVKVSYDGKVLNQFGAPVRGGSGIKAAQKPEAHIPLQEWLKWKEWFRP